MDERAVRWAPGPDLTLLSLATVAVGCDGQGVPERLVGGPCEYRFDTIRPGSYPGRSNPAHVHMHVIEVGCCTYYIEAIHFSDDPLLGAAEKEEMESRGGAGLVDPTRDERGRWVVRRDIFLGRNIPGYPR